jgi:hypothetical protein
MLNANPTVTFVTRPEDHVVIYRHGYALSPSTPGTYTHSLSTFGDPDFEDFVAAAPGKKTVRVTPKRSVDPLVIMLDLLWCATIVGVAAPIADAVVGGFVKTERTIEVQLEPDRRPEQPVQRFTVPAVSSSGSTSAAGLTNSWIGQP